MKERTSYNTDPTLIKQAIFKVRSRLIIGIIVLLILVAAFIIILLS